MSAGAPPARDLCPQGNEALSILSGAGDVRIEEQPFPHFVLRNALAGDSYRALAESYPELAAIAGSEPWQNNRLYKKAAHEVVEDPSFPPIWRDFFALHCSRLFFHQVLDVWESRIRLLYPGLEAGRARSLRELGCAMRSPGGETNPDNRDDVQLDCQFAVNSPVLRSTSVRGPHVDRHYKLFAAILYFRDLRDDSRGGELQLFRYAGARDFPPDRPVAYDCVDRLPPRNLQKIALRDVTPVKSICYEPNTLVMWLNTPWSIHGVSPRAETPWTRRYVNFLGEIYGGSQDGLFRRRRGPALRRLLPSRRQG